MKKTRTILAILMLVGLGLSLPAQAAEGDVVPLFTLKGPLPEGPRAMTFGPFLGEAEQITMFDLLGHLKEARMDPKVKAVILDIREAMLGSAQIQELRQQIEELKAAEKDVLIYCETLTPGQLFLGSSASSLILLPTGEVIFNGLYGEGLYFKGLLDNLRIEADILHCGAYKSAGEPFYRTGPSKEAEEQTNALLDSIFGQIVAEVAKSRGITPEKTRELVDVGLFSAEEALKAQLVDKLMYREDFIDSIKQRYGKDTKVVMDYGADEQPTLDPNNPFAILSFLTELMQGPKESDAPCIAVVYVEGAITSGPSEPGLFGGGGNAGSDTIRAAIAKAAADDRVKALVLRVDSPGGSAIASEIICEATKRFKATDRPFIVSMGNVAASGGYYVSTMADTIFAEPTTITGSIGVVGGKMVTKGLWDWVGVTSHEYKRGAHSDVMNNNRPFSEEERTLLMTMMTRIYDEFKGRVLEGRKDRIQGELEPLAGGRVYSGARALDIGLVDRLGGFAQAMKYAAEQADLGADFEVRVFPKPKSIFEALAEAFGSKEPDNEFTAAPGFVRSLFAANASSLSQIEALRSVDPLKVDAIEDFLRSVELLADENVILVGPPCPTHLR